MLDRLIATIEAESQKRDIGAERFVREQRILDELAPRLFKNLKAALRAEAEKYPNHFKWETHPETEAVIRGKSERPRVLEVGYLGDSKLVWVRCGEVEEEFSIRLDDQAQAVFCNGDSEAVPQFNS